MRLFVLVSASLTEFEALSDNALISAVVHEIVFAFKIGYKNKYSKGGV
jgi:hypothetical protein